MHHIGCYKILEKIGQGTTGEVFKVQEPFGKIYALKFFSRFTGDFELISRFQKETQTCSFSHPGVVRLIDSGIWHNTYFLVMEYIAGIPLNKYIAKEEISWQKALAIVSKLASTLKALHELCIVHYHIKPTNIILTNNENPILTDLKTSKVLAEAQQLINVGSLNYLAAEQIERKIADGRCDIYAIGCILYELLTAKRVIEGQDPQQIITAILQQKPIRPDSIVVGLPPNLSKICLKALARELPQRYANITLFLEDMQKVQNDLKGISFSNIVEKMQERNKLLSIGEKLDNFLIKKELGRGGMGVVYKAIDTRSNQTFALKLLKNEDPKIIKRFMREAKVITQLEHPNIVKIIKTNKTTKNYLVMEYIEGKTLEKLIKVGK